MPLTLQMIQKRQNQISVKLRQLQPFNRNIFGLGCILQEQPQCIAIAGQSAPAAATCALEVIDKKRLYRIKNRIWLFHGVAGLKPKLRRNRREAAESVCAVAWRYRCVPSRLTCPK